MSKKTMIGFLATAALVYLVVIGFMYIFQRHMMHFPNRTRPDPAAYGVQDNVQIVRVTTADGLKLEGWYFAPQDRDKPVIVNFHGNAWNIAERLPKMAGFIRAGYGVLLAEYRGYGGNPGKPTEEGLYVDARAYLKWLREMEGVSPAHIIFYGESLGTGVALQMAAEQSQRKEPVSAVVLEAPYSSVVDVAQSRYFFAPVRWLIKDHYKSTEKIDRVKAPILFLHGTKDRTIPIRFARKLFEFAEEPKTFVTLEGAAHNDLYDYGAETHVLDFLSRIDFSVTKSVEKEEL